MTDPSILEEFSGVGEKIGKTELIGLIVGLIFLGFFLFFLVLRSWINDDVPNEIMISATVLEKEKMREEWAFQYKWRIINSIIGLVCFASAFGLCFLVGR